MTYVALGDSYASGVGLAPALAYPVLLRDGGLDRFSTLTQAASSGAVTGDVLATQVSSLRADTRTVTLTVGGNDAGFATVVAACLHSPDPRLQAVLDQGAQWRAAAKAGAQRRIAFLGGPAAAPQDRTVPLVAGPLRGRASGARRRDPRHRLPPPARLAGRRRRATGRPTSSRSSWPSRTRPG